MRSLLLLVFFAGYSTIAVSQRFQVKLKNGNTIVSDRIRITEPLFENQALAIINGQRIKLSAIHEMHDSTFQLTYKTIRFRKRIILARELEKGKICLYDLHSPDFRESANVQRISSNNRLYYHRSGDTVLQVLNRKHFIKLVDSSFASTYPQFASIRKKYLRLHTTGILTIIMVPNLVTVVGFQSAAVLVPYIAGTTYITGSALINRQEKFRKIRQLVKDYNQHNM